MNAVIYARYSSHNQTEQSIEGQLHDNYAWAKQQGINVVGEYIDRALTGTTDHRPDFQRMIVDAAKHRFELVIVWKLDRFARNRYDSAVYKAALKRNGVRVVSVNESISDNPEGVILESVLEGMAEYYSLNLSQNVKRGLRETAAKGLFPGGTVPYGYKLQERRLVADERTAPAVRYMFEQYAAGVSKKEIIDELNRRGIRNKSGKPHTYNSFQKALANATYIGQYKYRGEVIPGLAEPIVSEDVFAKVQERLKSAARAPAASKADVRYLLQGKAFCGYCSAPMVGECGRSGGNGHVYHYYACANKKKKHTCKKKNEKKDFIEWYVVEQTMQYVLSPARTAYIAKAVVEEYDREFSTHQITAAEKAIAQVDRELTKLVDAFVDAPKVAREKIGKRIELLEAQKAEMEVDLARLQVACGIRFTEEEILAWLQEFCTGDPADEEFQQKIIDAFINSVYLYDDKIVIFYNIKGGKQISYVEMLAASEETGGEKSSDLKSQTRPSEPESESLSGFFLFRDSYFLLHDFLALLRFACAWSWSFVQIAWFFAEVYVRMRWIHGLGFHRTWECGSL